MIRREFFRRTLLGIGALPLLSRAQVRDLAEAASGTTEFRLNEITLTELQDAMASGGHSSVSVTRRYLQRIREIDSAGPTLNSVIELNPDVISIARMRDRERIEGRVRGPLHGIPILIKDNLDSADRMMTTAGSLALVGHYAKRDSFVVEKLRAAGAVILGKANLSEWANFRGYRSTSGWSARGGQTKNPYVLDRNPSGSSSGSAVAVAANLCAVAIGTETDGSILSPSSVCGIVGIKPTVGLVSRSGIIPIAASQDTAGPVARTVSDAAILLSAIAGTDERDPATLSADEHRSRDYSEALDADGLRGARIGVCRQFFGRNNGVDELMETTLQTLRNRGAVLVDPVEISTLRRFGRHEGVVLHHEFKDGLNRYLAGVEEHLPVHNLDELIAFNQDNAESELEHFGQEHLLAAAATTSLSDPEYVEARRLARQLAGEAGIDAVMNAHRLDALVAPTTGPAHLTDYENGDRGPGGSTSLAAAAGYPSITVPNGRVNGLPVGVSFFGRAWTEARLVQLAYAFEQATRHRIEPSFAPTR